jgi:hypothetical protein
MCTSHIPPKLQSAALWASNVWLTFSVIQGVLGGMCQTSESVPYVKVHWYNPKHLHPKLNGNGNNGERSFESMTAVTHLLITKYWQKYVVTVMLISVLNKWVT